MKKTFLAFTTFIILAISIQVSAGKITYHQVYQLIEFSKEQTFKSHCYNYWGDDETRYYNKLQARVDRFGQYSVRCKLPIEPSKMHCGHSETSYGWYKFVTYCSEAF